MALREIILAFISKIKQTTKVALQKGSRFSVSADLFMKNSDLQSFGDLDLGEDTLSIVTKMYESKIIDSDNKGLIGKMLTRLISDVESGRTTDFRKLIIASISSALMRISTRASAAKVDLSKMDKNRKAFMETEIARVLTGGDEFPDTTSLMKKVEEVLQLSSEELGNMTKDIISTSDLTEEIIDDFFFED
jgi:hypothetical protein